MLNCLLDTIQLWDECSTRSGSNYVDDLPQISNGFLRDIARSQDVDLPDLFARLSRNAARKVEEDLRGHLSGRLTVRSIVANQRVGLYPINPIDSITPAGITRKGLGIFYEGNAGLELVITGITIFPAQSGSLTVQVLDALNPSLVLGSVTGTAVSGQLLSLPVSISVSSATSRWGAFVSIPVGFATKESRIRSEEGCRSCATEFACLDGHTRVSGLVLTNSGTLQNRIDTGGISVDYAINCDLGQYICRSKGSFSGVMLNAFGVSAMEEALYSDRVNNSTVLDPERMAMLRDSFAERYKIALESVVQYWTMPNDLCFCNKPLVGWKTQVP
jgi:hypothetical protein